jgi:hypothetical protein
MKVFLPQTICLILAALCLVGVWRATAPVAIIFAFAAFYFFAVAFIMAARGMVK